MLANVVCVWCIKINFITNLGGRNTVFAHAFADAIQRVHKDRKRNMPLIEGSFFLLKHLHYLCYFNFSIIECSVLMVLILYKFTKIFWKRLWCKEPSNSYLFLCYRKNPVKCSACAVAQKIETDCFCRNLPISNDPVVRISRNLAKQ